MSPRDILKREFLQCEEEDAKGAFLLQLRSKCEWDWDAFRRLTSAMYDVAEEVKGQPSIERWIAEGFWYCDSEIACIASHSNFSRFPEDAYRDGVELIHNLASLLFSGQTLIEMIPCGRRPRANDCMQRTRRLRFVCMLNVYRRRVADAVRWKYEPV